MPNTAPIRVALAGDHSLNLHALAILLQQQGAFHIVSISRDVCQLRDNLMLAGKERYPHIVLLDINFDLYRAAGIVSFLSGSHPGIRIAALGLTKDRRAILRLERMGVHGYIAKNSDPSEMENMLKRLSVKTGDSVEQNLEGSDVETGVGPDLSAAEEWHSVTPMERRYFRLAMSEASDEELRRVMRVPQCEFDRFVARIYRQFGVRSSHGLVLALYRNRLMVLDDI